jgi:hypothetical protein
MGEAKHLKHPILTKSILALTCATQVRTDSAKLGLRGRHEGTGRGA